jgi:hypothetical protein
MKLGQHVQHPLHGWGVVSFIDDDVIEIMFKNKIMLF